MKNKILLLASISLLSGSFGLALVDKDFRDDFGRIATASAQTLGVLAKNDKGEKDKHKHQPK